MNTSQQIKTNMINQGRSFTWLMDQLDMSRRTFYIRMNNNAWSVGELMKLKDLGIL